MFSDPKRIFEIPHSSVPHTSGVFEACTAFTSEGLYMFFVLQNAFGVVPFPGSHGAMYALGDHVTDAAG